MSPAKYVNEYFFEQESKAMWYVLGLSYSLYSTQLQQGWSPRNLWRSALEEKIEMVKVALESDHTKSLHKSKNKLEGGKDYWIYVLAINSQSIYDALSKRGLDVPKAQRTFPTDIKEQYLDDFVRGFFDGHVSCINRIHRYERNGMQREKFIKQLPVYFNVLFLQELYKKLVDHINVRGEREIKKSPLIFGGPDIRKIYELIYHDESGLYLHSKKELFEVELTVENPPQMRTIDAEERISQVIGHLFEGMKAGEAFRKVGYSHTQAGNRAFKKATGQTTGQFLRESAVH